MSADAGYVVRSAIPTGLKFLRSVNRKSKVYPNVAKAGGFQSQGVKGEAVIDYRDPLTTRDLKSSSFPGR